MLDFLDCNVHLLLLLGLIIVEPRLDLLQLVGKLLSLGATDVQHASKNLVLAPLVHLHHVFHRLHLVVKLTHEALNFLT